MTGAGTDAECCDAAVRTPVLSAAMLMLSATMLSLEYQMLKLMLSAEMLMCDYAARTSDVGTSS